MKVEAKAPSKSLLKIKGLIVVIVVLASFLCSIGVIFLFPGKNAVNSTQSVEEQQKTVSFTTDSSTRSNDFFPALLRIILHLKSEDNSHLIIRKGKPPSQDQVAGLLNSLERTGTADLTDVPELGNDISELLPSLMFSADLKVMNLGSEDSYSRSYNFILITSKEGKMIKMDEDTKSLIAEYGSFKALALAILSTDSTPKLKVYLRKVSEEDWTCVDFDGKVQAGIKDSELSNLPASAIIYMSLSKPY